MPNAYSVILFAAGAALRLCSGGFHALQWGLIAAAVIFAFTVIFWRLGWMGGGDVKLLTAAAIFVPPFLVPMLIAATALAGGVLAIVFIIGRKLAVRPISPRPRAVLGTHFAVRAMASAPWRPPAVCRRDCNWWLDRHTARLKLIKMRLVSFINRKDARTCRRPA